MADCGCKWTDEEIRALLAIWSDATIQRQLLGATRNTAMFRNIKTRCTFHAQKLKRCLADMKISFEFVCIPAPDAFIKETLIPALCPDGSSRQSRLRSGGHHRCQKEGPFCVLLQCWPRHLSPKSHPPRKVPSASKRAPMSPPKQCTNEHVEKRSERHLDRSTVLIDYVLGDKINKHTKVQVNGKRV